MQETYTKMAEAVAKEDEVQDRSDLSKLDMEEALSEILERLHCSTPVTEPKGTTPKFYHLNGDSRYKLHPCQACEH